MEGGAAWEQQRGVMMAHAASHAYGCNSPLPAGPNRRCLLPARPLLPGPRRPQVNKEVAKDSKEAQQAEAEAAAAAKKKAGLDAVLASLQQAKKVGGGRGAAVWGRQAGRRRAAGAGGAGLVLERLCCMPVRAAAPGCRPAATPAASCMHGCPTPGLALTCNLPCACLALC